jgi:cyanate permease
LAPISKERARLARQVGVLTALPFVMLAGPLAGYLAGSWLDRRFGTGNLLLIILILLGTAGAGRETFKLIQLASRESSEDPEHRDADEKRERGVSDSDQSDHAR